MAWNFHWLYMYQAATRSCGFNMFHHPKEALKSAAAPPSLAPKRCAKVAGNQNLAQATGTRMVSKRWWNHVGSKLETTSFFVVSWFLRMVSLRFALTWTLRTHFASAWHTHTHKSVHCHTWEILLRKKQCTSRDLDFRRQENMIHYSRWQWKGQWKKICVWGLGHLVPNTVDK